MAAVFERAAAELKAAIVAVSDTHKLQLYGLFKQATVGDCSVAAPSAFRPVERAKWESWRKLKGTSLQDAKHRYVQLVKTLLPSFQAAVEEQKVVEPPTKATPSTRPRQEAPGRSSQLMQLLLYLATGAALLVAIKVAQPWIYVTADEELMQKLSPLLWFALGYLIVIVLRSKVRLDCSRRRRRAPVELDVFLRKHGVQVVRQPEEGYSVPRLMLGLPEDQDAFQFGDHNATIPYTVEQTADVYYRKFKEPLPDPASRLLHSIEVIEERHLDEYCAVFKRRLLRFRNEAPSLIKRFASSDFVEYFEDSLLDKQNRIESFISNFYCKNAPDARSYHLQRITEEFGPPTE
ncbi:Acyl-CoA-binding protein 3 [Phytophthora nicotianae]|uniref:Acyl-CoA-binding protein 3 n=1 Tax=Phytophthora nicotianae TaxID=4792 RepID=A0A0W8CUC3_PHYNI|nr:Acyl-CoA-binding protein 3 [Phytophthora nicotianae]